MNGLQLISNEPDEWMVTSLAARILADAVLGNLDPRPKGEGEIDHSAGDIAVGITRGSVDAAAGAARPHLQRRIELRAVELLLRLADGVEEVTRVPFEELNRQ